MVYFILIFWIICALIEGQAFVPLFDEANVWQIIAYSIVLIIFAPFIFIGGIGIGIITTIFGLDDWSDNNDAY